MKYRAMFVSFLAVLSLVALFADALAPYNPTAQAREHSLSPPTQIYWAHFGLSRPYVKAEPEDEHPSAETQRVPVELFAHGSTYLLFGFLPCDRHLFSVAAPGRLFLMGTDIYGRDLFSRFLCGTRISLLAGLGATLLTLTIGCIVGSISGYFSSWIDVAVMYAADLFLVLPWIYLLFIVRAFLPLHVTPVHTFFLIVSVVGLLGWAKPAKMVRGMVLSLKERGFILAGRSFGGTDLYLLRRHILPRTTNLLLTQASLLIPQYILAEVTLSFLGLGIGEPTASWGTLLANLQDYHVLVSCWWMYLPAFLLIPIFLGFALSAGFSQDSFQFQGEAH